MKVYIIAKNVMNYYYTKDVVVSGSKMILLFKRFIAYASKEVLFLLHVRNRQFLTIGLKKTDNVVYCFCIGTSCLSRGGIAASF
jgi:hypothetical protein